MLLYDVDEFDINMMTYNMIGKLYLVWCDPRKSFDPKLGFYQLTNDAAADQLLLYGQMWTPQITLLNGTAVMKTFNVNIYNFNDGTIM